MFNLRELKIIRDNIDYSIGYTNGEGSRYAELNTLARKIEHLQEALRYTLETGDNDV